MIKLAQQSIALVLLLAPAMSQGSTVFNLTGTGDVCAMQTDGSCTSIHSGAIYGRIELNVVASAPAGSDAFLYPNSQLDNNGWVASTYSFWWDGGSFQSTHIEDETHFFNAAMVANDATDFLYTTWTSERNLFTPDFYSTEAIYSNFYRGDSTGSWLDGLEFSESAGLASVNYSEFGMSSFLMDHTTGNTTSSGWRGLANWTSAGISVPGPSSFALVWLGLAALALARRGNSCASLLISRKEES